MEKKVVLKQLSSLFIPASSSNNEKLIVVLHGLGDSVEGYRFLPGLLGFANTAYLLINAPDAYYTGYSWFDIPGNPAPGIIRSRKLLSDSWQEVELAGWKLEDVALFGFSQGGFLVLDQALRYPKRFGAVLCISGFLFMAEDYPQALSSCASEQNILVTHGVYDPILPIDQVRVQMQFLQANGISLQWQEYNKEHTIDPVAEVSAIKTFLQENLGSC